MPYEVNVEVDDEVASSVDERALVDMLERVLTEDGVDDGASLAVVLSEDSLLHELNLRHREVDAPTDVLSFAADEGEAFPVPEGEPRYLGDIVVSVESVARQAAEAGLTTAEELAHVILHGLLHLLGYDHEESAEEAVMKAREEAVLGPGIHAGRGAHED
ncbi:MAG: rRNA maturation RNase YbeY [Dehalococcoidia bacterium]|nr:rRNA maturation RNase YbeY [Dehalococcoidia bacterium]